MAALEVPIFCRQRPPTQNTDLPFWTWNKVFDEPLSLPIVVKLVCPINSAVIKAIHEPCHQNIKEEEKRSCFDFASDGLQVFI